MESVEKGKDAILSGIETDAREEEKQIVGEAESRAAEKKKYAEKKIESILADARKQAEDRAQIVKTKILAGVGIEIKRLSMRLQDDVVGEIMNRVEKRLGEMIADTAYRSVLVDLICEAAAGLDTDSASVNASPPEREMIDQALLAEATGKIRSQTERQMTLKLAEAEPLRLQGVLLTASDGRTAFNNQIRTRIMRRQRKIRTMIQDTLFTIENSR
ncbi:MAG: hypothetical protein JW720_01225 [Sedimentisphaerales bacterium]|nr:hypothetical protein [Sedimentisphaerales bacterium]